DYYCLIWHNHAWVF
nr:immunoglobulin light chain junction region [Macaca mulatta]MOX82885.1 immunoglobulin light chain junction region [Macaca mulatta]